MKIKSTLLVLSLVLGLMSCSYNTGVLKKAQPEAPQTTTLKTASAEGHHFHMFLRCVNNTKFIAGGGILTHVDLIQKGNPRLGIKGKRVTIFDGIEHFNDLLNMNSGIMLDLADGQVDPPAGSYDFAVATVVPGSGWVEKANGDTCKLKFPGNKFILIFRPAIEVNQYGLSPADVVLDIDVSHSVVRRRNYYIFKPIVKVVNATSTGSLAGVVVDGTTGNPITGANVWIGKENGSYSTYSLDHDLYDTYGFHTPIGFYWIPGIPGGNYTAYASKAGYTTVSQTVSIEDGNFNEYNFILYPSSSN